MGGFSLGGPNVLVHGIKLKGDTTYKQILTQDFNDYMQGINVKFEQPQPKVEPNFQLLNDFRDYKVIKIKKSLKKPTMK